MALHFVCLSSRQLLGKKLCTFVLFLMFWGCLGVGEIKALIAVHVMVLTVVGVVVEVVGRNP